MASLPILMVCCCHRRSRAAFLNVLTPGAFRRLVVFGWSGGWLLRPSRWLGLGVARFFPPAEAGAGDVRLLGAVGAWLGPAGC
jgi:hypothetical protein